MTYEPGTRNGIEAARLRMVAAAAGHDADLLWRGALFLAARAERDGLPLDRHSPLVQMRSILDTLGVDHRAPDGFGTR